MRRTGRVDNQGLGIANVRQVREQLDVADQLLACLQATLDAEAQDSSITMRMILCRDLVLRMALESWIAHPGDGWMPS